MSGPAIIDGVLRSEAATCDLAARLAVLARPGDAILLHGTLGAGKSVFCRAFIRACTHPDQEVPSPTFTLVQVYDGRAGMVWHFDLYRIADADDVYELDIEDAFAEGISLIEWPDRLGPLTPATRLDVTLSAGPTDRARRVRLAGHGGWAPRLAGVSL